MPRLRDDQAPPTEHEEAAPEWTRSFAFVPLVKIGRFQSGLNALNAKLKCMEQDTPFPETGKARNQPPKKSAEKIFKPTEKAVFRKAQKQNRTGMRQQCPTKQ